MQAIALQEEAASLTYDFRGATLRGERPPGYRHDDEVIALGTGDECWRRAVQALRDWSVHRGAGLVVSDGAVVEPGAVVALAAPLPVGWVIAACRVVDVIDEANRFGFAYGTLPTHPETGEELFLLERGEDGTVVFRIIVLSRLAAPWTRVASPVARIIQSRATRRYLAAVQRTVQP